LKQYLDLLKLVLANGWSKTDRTGIGTLSIFGSQLRFSLHNQLPVITTKKIHTTSIIEELLWFLKGSTNIRTLQAKGVSIWDEWADENGDLGPIYGKQWRSWPEYNTNSKKSIDQLSNLVEELKKNPDSRRHIVSAWNVAQLNEMALMPCHILFQFYVHDKKLSCQVYQRSADLFLGLPFNITSYSLLTYMIAHQTNLEPCELIWIGGDCHIYMNHLQQVKKQLERKPFLLPRLEFSRRPESLFEYEYNDFNIIDYRSHDKISASVAV
tara:strand:+ start:10569 stop:11372 length:804 start_codon:yes stop_codon:yes gene_type:complete